VLALPQSTTRPVESPNANSAVSKRPVTFARRTRATGAHLCTV
jgi:hypothetical protein